MSGHSEHRCELIRWSTSSCYYPNQIPLYHYPIPTITLTYECMYRATWMSLDNSVYFPHDIAVQSYTVAAWLEHSGRSKAPIERWGVQTSVDQ